MAAPTFDAFVAALNTPSVPVLLVRAVGTSMGQVVIVAHSHVITVHPTEAFESFRNFDPIVVPTALVLRPRVGPRCLLGSRSDRARSGFLRRFGSLRGS